MASRPGVERPLIDLSDAESTQMDVDQDSDDDMYVNDPVNSQQTSRSRSLGIRAPQNDSAEVMDNDGASLDVSESSTLVSRNIRNDRDDDYSTPVESARNFSRPTYQSPRSIFRHASRPPLNNTDVHSTPRHPEGRCTFDHGRGYSYERQDLVARANLQSLISSIMISPDPVHRRLQNLEDCKESVASTRTMHNGYRHPGYTTSFGIPFEECVSNPMGELGVPPLLYELMQCKPDWNAVETISEEDGLQVVRFLIQNWREDPTRHGKRGTLMGILREACWRRDEDNPEHAINEDEQQIANHWVSELDSVGNKLFQQMIPLVRPYHLVWKDKPIDYIITITALWGKEGMMDEVGDEKGFKASLFIGNFKDPWKDNSSVASSSSRAGEFVSAPTRPDPFSKSSMNSLQPGYRPVVVEFVAANRVWSLEFRPDEVKLTLLDGPDVVVKLPVLATPVTTPADENPFRDPTGPSPITPTQTISTAPVHITVDARLLIEHPGSSEPFQILFPKTPVRPATYNGASSLRVKPFSAGHNLPSAYEMRTESDWTPTGFNDPRLLHDGSLIMEIVLGLSITDAAKEIDEALMKYDCEYDMARCEAACFAGPSQVSSIIEHPVEMNQVGSPGVTTTLGDAPVVYDNTTIPVDAITSEVNNMALSPGDVTRGDDLSLTESDWEVVSNASKKERGGTSEIGSDGEASTLDDWVDART